VSGNTLLHVAAYHDQREVAAAILASCPALVHVRNHKFDSTPLDCAMHKGLAEMVCSRPRLWLSLSERQRLLR
jgi:hypothetical protein